MILERPDICIDKYWALEIDEDAMSISRMNHLDSVIQKGDMRAIEEEDIINLGEVHLVIATLPCTELSKVKPHRKGLDGKFSLLTAKKCSLLTAQNVKILNKLIIIIF